MQKHMRHIGGGLLALFDEDGDYVREVGVAAGWNFMDRDVVIVRYNAYTTAQRRIERLEGALRAIRDSTFRNAVTLRGMADAALQDAE
ncbi:hypothetical protein [Lysobacter olei]